MKCFPDEVGISINRLSQPSLLRFRSFLGLLDDLGKKGQKMDVILKHVETTEFFSEDYFFTSRSDCVGITEVRT